MHICWIANFAFVPIIIFAFLLCKMSEDYLLIELHVAKSNLLRYLLIFQVMWDDIIGEPEGIKSTQCAWNCSYKCFRCTSRCCYILLTTLFAPCLAFCSAVNFACLAFQVSTLEFLIPWGYPD